MWYKNVYSIFIFLMFFVGIIRGSCLEYGHSCWGAHGKRSGGTHFRAGPDLNNVELTLLPENNENHGAGLNKVVAQQNKNFFENFQDTDKLLDNNAAESNNNDGVENDAPNKQLHLNSKLRRILRNRHREFLASNDMLDEDSIEPPELNAHLPTDRWRRMPILPLQKYSKQALSNGGNDLYQHGERKPEHGAYLDYE